ncbi:MAG: lamin tail domain-containing protein [Cyclobacteriaceae bacterium]
MKPFPGFRLKTFSVLLLSLLVIQNPFAQVNDDFSDGDFTTSPSWNGTTSSFIINNSYQLQLNSAIAGTSYLYIDFSSSPSENVEWEFFVKQSFAPSGANFGRFYLISDQSDLSSPLNGYYLQFGEAGSNDAVELFRQSGTTSSSVCRANAAGISSAFEMRVKVTRKDQGQWEVFIDYTGGSDFSLHASGTDNTHKQSIYAGILCTYTITNATRFYYDDISIRRYNAPDTSPPEILSLSVASPQSMRLFFSEDPDRATAENPLNYYASPTPGNPASVRLQEDDKSVELFFSKPFINGKEGELTVNGIADATGNVMKKIALKFLYFEPSPVQFKDVIITEFCPDPSPQVGLPEAEFVEVLNRSENPIDLSGWTLSDEASSGKFEPIILLPGQYLILSAPSAAEKFSSFGQVLVVSPFPSINNSGDILVIKHSDGRTIDSLKFSTSWYSDDEKADGGWSLELIDPENICAEKNNWVAAETSVGGTPGKQNSAFANLPDNTGPKILTVTAEDAYSLLIVFNEKLESITPPAERFVVDPFLGISSVRFVDGSHTTLALTLLDQIQPSKNYSLAVSDVYDCSGNKIQDAFSQAYFVLPEKAEPHDVLLNEILFNPRPTGVDFVEIYNRSEKTIQLKNWSFRNFNSALGNSRVIFSKENLIIHPGQYRVFTEDAFALKGEYILGMEETFCETDLPAFNDDEGSVAIVDEEGTVIDSMFYADEMHVPFISDGEGVSLERISFSPGSEKASNWRSASSTSGFATPGYLNSNARGDGYVDDGSVSVDPEILQPYVSSRDFTQIKYRFESGGFIANVKIFDQEGRAIRKIAQNQLLGAEGFFRWDGDEDNGSPARTGYYLVWFEIFNSAGQIKTFKKRVAIY